MSLEIENSTSMDRVKKLVGETIDLESTIVGRIMIKENILDYGRINFDFRDILPSMFDMIEE